MILFSYVPSKQELIYFFPITIMIDNVEDSYNKVNDNNILFSEGFELPFVGKIVPSP